MLILFFLVACLAHGAYTVYRVLKERSEVGESDSLIGKVLPHAVLFFLLAVVAVGVGNLFDNIDKHTAACKIGNGVLIVFIILLLGGNKTLAQSLS